MILVTGCGFCGANLVTSILQKMDIYIGKYFLPTSAVHPYAKFEDMEWDHTLTAIKRYGEDTEYVEQLTLELVLTRHHTVHNEEFNAIHYIDWAFKAPNSFLYIDYLKKFMDIKFIVCIRDEYILFDRMVNKWNYDPVQADQRIVKYKEIVSALSPRLEVNHETMKEFPEINCERIASFIGYKGSIDEAKELIHD